MSRIHNLYEFHKEKYRYAVMDENYKKLTVVLKYHTNPLSSKSVRKQYESKKMHKLRKPKVSISKYEVGKNTFKIEINQKKKNQQNLYDIFIIICYLFGKQIILHRYINGFPFFPTPEAMSFGRYNFDFGNARLLLTDTEKVIQTCHILLTDQSTYFSQLVPFLLRMNTLPYPEVRFTAEFTALELLSNSQQVSGNILKEEEKISFKEWKEEIIDLLRAERNLSSESKEYIINKINKLPEKGVIKEKVYDFIKGLNSQELQKNLKNIKKWYELRNDKSIAHSNILKSKTKITKKDLELMKDLHHFLGDIVNNEFRDKFKAMK